MNNRCDECNGSTHCNGRGTFELFDQDGRNHFVCQCSCGYSRRQREAVRYDLSPLIRRYGKKALLETLAGEP
jgi:hypothetical protein